MWQHPAQAQSENVVQQRPAPQKYVIPLSVLKPLAAELGPAVKLMEIPLLVSEIEANIGQANNQGKLMDQLTGRYGTGLKKLEGLSKVIHGLNSSPCSFEVYLIRQMTL